MNNKKTIRSEYVSNMKIKKTTRSGYFGFSEISEFLKMDYEAFIQYAIGELIISIGQGKFRDRAREIISQAAAWGIYHDKGV